MILFGSLAAADLDGDGDSDVLASSATSDIAWYENTDAQGAFAAAQSLAVSGGWLESADVDGDGDLDVLSGGPTWHENTDGLGSFGPPQSIGASGTDPRPADLDADGDVDVLSSGAWYENTDGLGTFGAGQALPGAAGQLATSDVDGDGDLDAVSSQGTWHENVDGLGTFGAAQSFVSPSGSATEALDVDRDGRVDVVMASFDQDRILWKKNRSGQAALHSTSLDSGIHFAGALVELLSIDVDHLGRPGDAALDVGSLELLFDRAARTPLAPRPVEPLTSAEASALVDDLFVYRDDGSGVLETGTDALVATLGTLTLTGGVQTVTLTGPDARVEAAGSARFFVAAQLSPLPGPAREFLVQHRGSRAGLHHEGTQIALSQAPGSGTQPRAILWLDPAGDDDLDGLANAAEVDVHGTDPLIADSDHDGLSDGAEVGIHGTDPLVADSDGDGLIDGDEVNLHGSDPNVTDTDGDGLSDGDEVNVHGTSPLLPDTDGDGLIDGDEVAIYGTDPLVDGDSDGDGVSDADEIARGRSPVSSDTDGDGVDDDLDNCPSAYNPLQRDRGGLGSALPDGVGDLCQNGDFNGDGILDMSDVTLERRGLVGLEPALDPALPPAQP